MNYAENRIERTATAKTLRKQKRNNNKNSYKNYEGTQQKNKLRLNSSKVIT